MKHCLAIADRSRRTRTGGFTLIELLVSLSVLVIGILALASSSATITRLLAGGARGAVVAELAQSRFDVLRSTPCGSRAAGSAAARGFVERWAVTSGAPGAIDITEEVAFATPNGARTRIFRSVAPC